MEDIPEKRAEVLKLIKKYFKDDLITPKKVELLFHAYDLVFFEGKILERLNTLAKTGNVFPQIEFTAQHRNSGYGSLSGFYYNKTLVDDKYIYTKVFFIDVSPDILKDVDKSNPIPKAAGFGCDNKIECFMLIMEHEIIHMLFALWEFDVLQKEDKELYGSHGKLFNCMLNTYFGHTEYSHNLSLKGIPFPNYISKPIESLKYGFQYWENSCYMDSVLTTLLENQCGFWRDNIFSWNQDLPSKNPELANLMKNELQKDFLKLEEKPVKCVNFRNLLAIHDPAIQRKKSWLMYEVAAFYANLAELYPNLKIDVPVRMIRPGLDSPIESVRYKSEYLFLLDDYINPEIKDNEDYKKILWKECQSPVLVFSNQGTRRIKNFDKADKEKKRILKPRILGKYKFVGVTVLQGKINKEGGGSHYVSYFLAQDNKWYSYDDMSPKIKMVGDGYVDDLPRDGVWREQNNRMPTLYFYALDEYGIDRRRTEKLAFEKANRPDGGVMFKIVAEQDKVKKQIAIFVEENEGTLTLQNTYLFARMKSISLGDNFEDFLMAL